MRNQEISACLGNVSYTDVQRCAGCDAATRSQCFGKIKRGHPRIRDPQAVPPAAGLQAQTMHSTAEEHCTERSVLARPIFVFGKKDHPLKRPAEDPVCKAENDFIYCSKKRARSSSCVFQKSGSESNIDTTLAEKRRRSSSFTVLPRFPPSQPAKKSNIFMTSALLQQNIDMGSTKEGSLSESQLWNVIRPAILQPPQALTCPENPAVSLVTKKQAHIQLSEDNSYSSSENSAGSKAAVKSSITVNISSSKTAQSQLLEDRSVLSSSNSGFVFGENMVERVVSPEKHSVSCNEVDSYKREITSLYIESFHVTKTALLRNATQTESAAARISKPGEKILLDKVEVITGEEEEHNVLQINCKLFLFNKLSLTWIEKGRGSLRLNDTSSNKCGMLQSRLIMRNQGSLRLILNTRLWGQMVLKRANSKSLCFTATDQEDHSVQVFLIQARSKDAGYLYAAIHHRLVALRSCAEQESDANQIDTESETAFHLLNCDSDEDDEKITQVSSSGSGRSMSGICADSVCADCEQLFFKSFDYRLSQFQHLGVMNSSTNTDHSRWNRRQPVVCS